jgi:hypothetical protein
MKGKLSVVENPEFSKNDPFVLINLPNDQYDFFAIRAQLKKLEDGSFGIDKKVISDLGIKAPAEFFAIPF